MPTSPELWGQVVSAAVVPVVMISACGLLTLSFYNRLTAVLASFRVLEREVLRDLEDLAPRSAPGETRRLGRRARARRSVDARRLQADFLLRRAGLMRRAIYFMLSAAALFILCSLAVGAGVFARPALYAAAAFFVLGLGSVLAALVYAMIELSVALAAVRQEHEMIGGLAEELERAEGDGKEKGNG